MKIKEIIARVRALYNKGVETDDSRLSDRLVYSKLCSARSLFVKREIDKKRQVSDWIIQTISCLELEEAHPNDCPCLPPPGCKMLKSKHKLPKPIQSVVGPEMEAVTNMDGTVIYSKTNWVKKRYKSGDKFTSNNPDYFIKDEYLFLTERSMLTYISLSGVFEDPLAPVYLNACLDKCIHPHEEEFPIDGHLMDVVIQATVQELVQTFKALPSDDKNDGTEDKMVVPRAQPKK